MSYITSSQTIIESNNQFTFDFYKKIKSNGNFIFSPASITSAMAMTYVGAKENTLKEISNTFYFNTNLNEFHKDFNSLTQFNINKSSDLQFYNANSIWIDKNLKMNSDYLSNNKKYYSGSAFLEDFNFYPEKARLNINNWVEKNTNNKITELLKPSSITSSTRMVLVNAIYFKGSWDKQFNEKNNTKEDFQVSKRNFQQKTFMNTQINSWYYEDKYAEIIDIPYSDNKYSMMIILPKSYRRMKCLERKLNDDYYKNYTQKRESKRIILSIPKFDMESDYELNETLQKMGIKDAFNSSADFTGITESERLYISNVIHKAKITVNEEGTEAAAATAVVMRKTSVMIESVEFKANRPFIYILRNNENNCIYFMGKVVNPN
jgi:serpin B